MRLSYRDNAGIVVQRVAEVADRAADMTPVLEDVGERMVEFSIPENFRRGGRPDRWPKSDWSRGELMRETSQLLDSVNVDISAGRLQVGTNKRYAAQRHYGGELRPKRAKALAVPLPGVSRSMARPRRWGAELQFLPANPADPDSRGVLGIQVGDRFEPKFALRGRVMQPARPFLLWQDDDLAYAERAVVAFVVGGADADA